MKGRYSQEFKNKAVSLVLEQGNSVQAVAHEMGVSDKSLYNWLAKARPSGSSGHQVCDEIDRLKAELRQVKAERDILKEASVFFSVESEKNTHS
ncbi:transposase [Vibrio hippocampi]|uniref:Transposase n=1 Tax=Vibrio hippocampi TaxID=654686 RepID=A0ABN8DHJ0_9VIBR|nr:transposase [Vibrio hippocampi]CAH0526163.1 hypothetical protein VHP8226_01637 [Vibrio hippocampi]